MRRSVMTQGILATLSLSMVVAFLLDWVLGNGPRVEWGLAAMVFWLASQVEAHRRSLKMLAGMLTIVFVEPDRSRWPELPLPIREAVETTLRDIQWGNHDPP